MNKQNRNAFARHLSSKYGLGEVSISNYLGSVRRVTEEIGDRPTKLKLDKYLLDMKKSRYLLFASSKYYDSLRKIHDFHT